MLYDSYITLRHLFELLGANLIFFFPAAKKRNRFWLRAVLGLIVLCAVAVPLYLLVVHINTEFAEQLSWSAGAFFTGITLNYYAYYILLDIVLLLVYLNFCFDVTPDTLLFLSLAARAVDLIKGVIFYLVEFNAFGTIKENDMTTIIVYGAVRLVVVAAFYVAMYFLIGRKWHPGDNMQIINSKISCIVYITMILVFFVTNTLMTLLIYATDISLRYSGIVIEAFFGVFVLITLASIQINNKQKMEKHILYNLMEERGKQYLVSKENMEIMNRKYHDLKHQIAALKAIGGGGGENSIKELEQSLSIYDSMIKTGNEIIDTILTEKSLHCAQKEIQFNYNIDSRKMEFIDAVDLYTMLGNAIDNAIEAAAALPDKEKQIINLSIENNSVMIMIQINNYCQGGLKFSGDLPKTTKQDGNFHGFGMKSIKAIAEKYHGNIRINVNDEIFTLNIGIPIPYPS